MTTARSDLPPASDPNASADDLDDSVADIMPKIDGAAGDDTGEMMVVDAGASDAVPLLAPTSSTPELAEIRPVPNEDSNRPRRSPLLGTICSQSIENARGSSKTRSPESLCYTKLLHNSEPGPASIPQNCGKNGRRSFRSPWASMRGEMRRSFWPLL